MDARPGAGKGLTSLHATKPKQTHTKSARTRRRLQQTMPSAVIRFELAFPREDVFKELISPTAPLGIDLEEAKVTTLKQGRGSVTSLNAGVSPGYMRKVSYNDDESGAHDEQSELIELRRPAMLRWREGDHLNLAGGFAKMYGAETEGGLAAPESLVTLEPSGTGTAVSITLTYGKVTAGVPLCCLAPALPALFAAAQGFLLAKRWSAQLSARGYANITPRAIAEGLRMKPSSPDLKATVKNTDADRSEEEKIKQQAAEKAQAAS